MRGSLIKQHGKWYVIADVGFKPDGTRDQRWIPTGTSNKTEAEEIHHPRIMEEIRGGVSQSNNKLTLEEYITNKWLPHIYHKVRSSTYDTYVWATKNHIIPALGKNPLKKLQPLAIQFFLDSYKDEMIKYNAHLLKTERMIATGQDVAPMDKPIGATSVKYIYNVLYQILSYAQQKKIIIYNPCEPVDVPEISEFKLTQYDEEQMKTLLGSVVDTEICIPVILAATTGVRIGEACGLRWSDVRDNETLILVRHALNWVNDTIIANPVNKIIWHYGKLGLRPVKSRQRLIDLPDLTIDTLKKARQRYGEMKNKNGSAFNDFDFVWCHDDGTPYSPDHLYEEFKELLETLKLPAIRFHDLRHSHATILRDRGVSMETICERLGHFASSYTHKTYAHPTKNTQKVAAQAMNSVLVPSSQKS